MQYNNFITLFTARTFRNLFVFIFLTHQRDKYKHVIFILQMDVPRPKDKQDFSQYPANRSGQLKSSPEGNGLEKNRQLRKVLFSHSPLQA